MRYKLVESMANMLLIVLLLMAAVSYNGKLFGYKTERFFKDNKDIEVLKPNAQELLSLGLTADSLYMQKEGLWSTQLNSENKQVINTLAFSKNVYGFGGHLPMFLYLENQTIKSILIQDNNETPDFLESVLEKGIVKQWIGQSIQSISNFSPDAVSGATMTSNAINRSISQSISGISNTEATSSWESIISIKNIAALLVILLAIVLSFRAKGNKKLRLLQLVLNTVILGLWCGKFISIKVLVGWTSNGMNLLSSGIVFLMLILAIVMPLVLNRRRFYCQWLCPFGSAQELVGKVNPKKFQLPKSIVKWIRHLPSVLTLGLFFFLWLGIAADLVDYEPFSAFLFQHASMAVLIISIVVIISSLFIHRPWCRFACPTGQVLSWVNKMD